MKRVLDSLRVYPVAPTEFAKLLQDDDDDRAKITSAEEPRVPGLIDGLSAT